MPRILKVRGDLPAFSLWKLKEVSHTHISGQADKRITATSEKRLHVDFKIKCIQEQSSEGIPCGSWKNMSQVIMISQTEVTTQNNVGEYFFVCLVCVSVCVCKSCVYKKTQENLELTSKCYIFPGSYFQGNNWNTLKQSLLSPCYV